MASEKQIAANRRNATRSTGPRTASGKSTSSRNAFRHGLSLPLEIDASVLAKLEGLTRTIAGREEDKDSMVAATEAAVAQLEMLRMQKVRAELLATMDLGTATLEELQRLLAIDRYERRARTRRRRASSRMR